MGKVIDKDRAFRVCHGYKIGDELILWSPGVIGPLDDLQEFECKKIIIENAPVPLVFDSAADALKAKINEIPPKKLGQMAAIRRCAELMDLAEDEGLIKDIKDVYSFMDYCMEKQGFKGEKERYVRREIKEFIDEHFTRLWGHDQ